MVGIGTIVGMVMTSCRAVGREEGLYAICWRICGYTTAEIQGTGHMTHTNVDVRGVSDALGLIPVVGTVALFSRTKLDGCLARSIFSDLIHIHTIVVLLFSAPGTRYVYYGITRWGVMERRPLLQCTETIVAQMSIT